MSEAGRPTAAERAATQEAELARTSALIEQAKAAAAAAAPGSKRSSDGDGQDASKRRRAASDSASGAAAAGSTAAAAAAAAAGGAGVGKGAAAAAASVSLIPESEAVRCPVCWDPVAHAAKPPCGHLLCRVCARQMFRGGADARCPQCRATVAESELQDCAAADAKAEALAKSTMDAEGFAEWEQRRADGAALAGRHGAPAADDGARGADEVGGAAAAAAPSAAERPASEGEAHRRYMASAAPNGSGKCVHCKLKIGRGEVRLHEGGGFVHLACKDFAQDCADERNAIRERLGAGAQVVVNVVTNPEAHGPCGLNDEQLAELRRKLREPAGSQPWWCVVRHSGRLWAGEAEEEEDEIPSEDEFDDFDPSSSDDEDDDHPALRDAVEQYARAMAGPDERPQVTAELMVSAAPTGRARCAGCGLAIPRNSPRLHEATGTGFRHFHCRDFNQEWTACAEAARQGEEGDVSLTVRTNIDAEGVSGIDRGMVRLLKQMMRSTGEALPDWVSVRHRGSFWEANLGTPRPGDSSARGRGPAGASGASTGASAEAGATAGATAGAAAGGGAARDWSEAQAAAADDAERARAASASAAAESRPRGTRRRPRAESAAAAAPQRRSGGGDAAGPAAAGDSAGRPAAAAIFARASLTSSSDEDEVDGEEAGRGAPPPFGYAADPELNQQYLALGSAAEGILAPEYNEDPMNLDAAAVEMAGALGAALGGHFRSMRPPEAWASITLSYTASAAPTDRSRCRVCSQAIAQVRGSLPLLARENAQGCVGCRRALSGFTTAGDTVISAAWTSRRPSAKHA